MEIKLPCIGFRILSRPFAVPEAAVAGCLGRPAAEQAERRGSNRRGARSWDDNGL
jgi:hypothetical protein